MKKYKRNGNKTHSLSYAIIRSVVIILTVPLVLLFSIYGTCTVYRSAHSSISKTLPTTVSAKAEAVSNQLFNYINLAQDIASDRDVYDTDDSAIKTSLYSPKFKSYNVTDLFFVDEKGVSSSNGNNYSNKDFYKAAMKGETYIGVPELCGNSGELGLPISAPIWKNGVEGSQIIGVVVCVVPQSIINDIVLNTKLSENSKTIILDKNGNTIAYDNLESVENSENLLDKYSKDKKVLSCVQEAILGNNVVNQVKVEGEKKILAFSPIPNTDGWSIGIEAHVKDFTNQLKYSILFFVVLSIIFLAFAIWGSCYLAKKIMSSLKVSMDTLNRLAKGDFSTPVENLDPKFNIQDLIDVHNYVRTVRDSNNAVINDIDFILGEMANGNLNVESGITEKYVGDYSNILLAENSIRSQLNDNLREILRISELVASESDQVSSGAQSLAQGATEQSGSIQELSASILEVNQNINKNAKESENAKVLTTESARIMKNSLYEMEKTLKAMEKISSTSNDISKVIKAIDDIAFQTNILSLNAAVEAARAGEAGKGFAVVADEVRNLSQKSAEAAKNSTMLIESSINAVEQGTKLVNQTSTNFKEVAEKSDEVTDLVGAISDMAQQQAEAVNQISFGIEQISTVVQQNSATSEESAAASEELSAQAKVLKELVRKFKLSEENIINS